MIGQVTAQPFTEANDPLWAQRMQQKLLSAKKSTLAHLIGYQSHKEGSPIISSLLPSTLGEVECQRWIEGAQFIYYARRAQGLYKRIPNDLLSIEFVEAVKEFHKRVNRFILGDTDILPTEMAKKIFAIEKKAPFSEEVKKAITSYYSRQIGIVTDFVRACPLWQKFWSVQDSEGKTNTFVYNYLYALRCASEALRTEGQRELAEKQRRVDSLECDLAKANERIDELRQLLIEAGEALDSAREEIEIRDENIRNLRESLQRAVQQRAKLQAELRRLRPASSSQD